MYSALFLSFGLLTGQSDTPADSVGWPATLPALVAPEDPLDLFGRPTSAKLGSDKKAEDKKADKKTDKKADEQKADEKKADDKKAGEKAPKQLELGPVPGMVDAKAGEAGPCHTLPCTPGGSRITWLRRWSCEDLEMKPAERHCHAVGCGLLHRLLWCPKSEGTCEGPAKRCATDCDANPLMQSLRRGSPAAYERMECRGIRAYGWVQQGYTANFDSPDDRLNFGLNFNDRSNDYQLNQFYFVLEKPLDLEKKKGEFHIGWRGDFFFGHDAPNFENRALGLFDNVTGNRLNAPRTTEFGIAAPQFYVDAHLPVLTDRGVDLRMGRFYALMSHEKSPAPETEFYSHSYEYSFATPFTLTGFMSTVHLADTVELYNGLVRGWEVNFQDINDVWGYAGGLVWNSCDKRSNLTVRWITSPEQLGNGPFALTNPAANGNWRSVLTSYYTQRMGCRDQWRFSTGGNIGREDNAARTNAGRLAHAEWYGWNTYLFYTVDPRLVLGSRFEWFRDDDGARTAYLNRPGFADNFFELTFGGTWRPYQNLRLRPELRFDWSGSARPYNDLQDRMQTTFAFDVIYDF